MVSVNANVDVKSHPVIDTVKMNEDLFDLCDEKLGITFVARDQEFFNEAWLNETKGKTYMQIALPYEEVLSTDNVNLLAYKHLYQHLDKLIWLDHQKIKKLLKEKITSLESSSSN